MNVKVTRTTVTMMQGAEIQKVHTIVLATVDMKGTVSIALVCTDSFFRLLSRTCLTTNQMTVLRVAVAIVYVLKVNIKFALTSFESLDL